MCLLGIFWPFTFFVEIRRFIYFLTINNDAGGYYERNRKERVSSKIEKEAGS